MGVSTTHPNDFVHVNVHLSHTTSGSPERVQDFATGNNFSFNQCHTRSFAFFSRESYFIKAIENLFPVFEYPDINTRGVGRILDSYANPRLRLGFA